LRFDGTSWSWTESGFVSPFQRLRVGPDGAVYGATSSSGLAVFEDGAWNALEDGTGCVASVNALVGLASGELWAVCSNGGVIVKNGSTWSELPLPVSGSLQAIWGDGPDDLFVGGKYANLKRWDGAGWSDVVDLVETISEYAEVKEIWASGPDDVYLAIAEYFDSALYHFDGASLDELDFAGYADIRTVHGNGADDVYAVSVYSDSASNDVTVWHFDGAGWAPSMTGEFYSPTATDLLSIQSLWSSALGDVLFGGWNGLILRGACGE